MFDMIYDNQIPFGREISPRAGLSSLGVKSPTSTRVGPAGVGDGVCSPGVVGSSGFGVGSGVGSGDGYQTKKSHY
jgi:hypothetical protein